MRRRRKPELPHFATLDQLAPGRAFNPYRLFEAWSVHRAIASYPKLRPGAKFLWLTLAHEVYTSGSDRHSQASLAERIGLSVDQLQYHLGHLVKAKLVHIEHELGRQNYTWLLYHPLFALCSPRTHRESPAGGTGLSRQGVPGFPGTQRYSSEELIRGYGVLGRNTATGSTGTDENGRRQGEEPFSEPNRGENFRERINGKPPFAPSQVEPSQPARGVPAAFSLELKPDFKRTWYGFSIGAKQNRREQAHSVAERIRHFQDFLKDPAEPIRRQARHEVNRAMAELSELGFFISPNHKEQR